MIKSKKDNKDENIIETMLQLNTNIKLIRELSGIGQEKFAKLIKTNISNLKTYETTDVRPKANVLAEIADYANVTIEDLEKKKLTHKDIKIKSKKDDKDEGKEHDEIVRSAADKMLSELIRAHNKQADSLKDVSAANLIWARNTENLIAKMGTTAGVEQGNHSDFSETVARIAAVLVMLGTGKRWSSEQEAKEEIGNIVPLPGWGKE